MLVEGRKLTTIWVDNNKGLVKIIDQRFLPHKLKIINLNSLSDAAYAIKEMQVRGAPLIGVTAAYGMYLASKENSIDEHLLKASKLLKESRPTAVNLKWAVDKIISLMEEVE